jgi:hypothetical protein
MSLKIRKNFRDICVVHQGIINHLKAQKVRHDKLMEKYSLIIEGEMNIPSNRFLNWTRAVKPYQDSVVTSKLIDFELIQEYEKFIKDLVNYETDFIISEEIIQDMEYGYDLTIEAVLRLEKKIVDIKKQYNTEIIQSKLHAISLYQALPDNLKRDEGYCIYCGIKLDINRGDTNKECLICQNVPEDLKPIQKDEELDQNLFPDDVEDENEMDETMINETLAEYNKIQSELNEEEPIPFLDIEDKMEETKDTKETYDTYDTKRTKEAYDTYDTKRTKETYDTYDTKRTKEAYDTYDTKRTKETNKNNVSNKNNNPDLSNEIISKPEDQKSAKFETEKNAKIEIKKSIKKEPIKQTNQDKKISKKFNKFMKDFEIKYKNKKKKLDGLELDDDDDEIEKK